MKSLQNGFIVVILLIGMLITQALSEESQANKEKNFNSQIQVLDKNIVDIQEQIDKLERKGIENLSDNEFEKLVELQDLLLVAMRSKTEKQKMIIVEEKEKTQQAYNSINETLDSIKRSLSAGSASK